MGRACWMVVAVMSERRASHLLLHLQRYARTRRCRGTTRAVVPGSDRAAPQQRGEQVYSIHAWVCAAHSRTAGRSTRAGMEAGRKCWEKQRGMGAKERSSRA